MPGNKDLSNFDPKTYKDLNEFDSKFNSKRDKLLLNVKQPEQRRIKAELKAKIKKQDQGGDTCKDSSESCNAEARRRR